MPTWLIATLLLSALIVGAIAGIISTFYLIRHLIWKVIDIVTDRN